MRKATFVVSLVLPPYACAADAEEFIRTAIRAERGHRNPADDVMARLDRDTVSVDWAPDLSRKGGSTR